MDSLEIVDQNDGTFRVVADGDWTVSTKSTRVEAESFVEGWTAALADAARLAEAELAVGKTLLRTS